MKYGKLYLDGKPISEISDWCIGRKLDKPVKDTYTKDEVAELLIETWNAAIDKAKTSIDDLRRGK